ncbi:hypothetical protein CCZ01_09050 [Helicobacter monodelphidis]|uniref:hypothetical protein n=1 Tax=Helicobacter sp. 15-1451 TaxID=2004995 RepID=UPI000DCE7DA3|nr:hypothetical protein [Helicobacter sp. 15-1451]RAX56586.1 hypothetical protein CCZ01_09050 [Helicobacter sp. 15-1451]
MKQVLSIIFFCAFFVGCSQRAYFQSFIDPSVEVPLQEKVADDLSIFLREYFNPANTTLYIHPQMSALQPVLEEKLQKFGFGLTDNEDTKNVTYVSYEIAKSDNYLLVTYNINEARINKTFIIEKDGVIKLQGYTNLNFNRPKVWTAPIVLAPKEESAKKTSKKVIQKNKTGKKNTK